MPSATFWTEVTFEVWATVAIGNRSRRGRTRLRMPRLIGEDLSFVFRYSLWPLAGIGLQARVNRTGAREIPFRAPAHGARELREEATRRRVVQQILRVPLDRHEPRPVRLQRLDETVGRDGRDLQAGSDPLDRLVVPAVDVDLGRSRDRGDASPRRDAHRMVVPFVLLAWHEVDDPGGTFGPDVLHERAPHRDVDHLEPETDPESRQALLPGGLEGREVGFIPVRVHLDVAIGFQGPSIARRVHVQAAAEDHAIERPVRLRARRQHDDLLPPEPRIQERPDVVVLLVFRSVVSERQSDSHVRIVANRPLPAEGEKALESFPMRPVYVLSAARTPIGKFGGSFAALTAADLGEVAAKAALERSGLPPGAPGGR